MDYFCYIIYNNNLSYVGITNNLSRRIKQHNNLMNLLLIIFFMMMMWYFIGFLMHINLDKDLRRALISM